MVLWVKIAVVALGAAALGGAIAVFGLPPGLGGRPPVVATAPQPVAPQQPAAPAAPAESDKPKAADAAPAPAQTAPAQTAAASPDASKEADARPAAQAPLTAPSFDVVRVEPTGDAVIAGRADPDVQVSLLRDGTEHDKARTDTAGQFAMVPPPFKPGTYDLALTAKAPDGRQERSRQTVTVSVPAGAGEVIVALASPDRPTEVLTQNSSGKLVPVQKPVEVKPGERARVSLATVEAEDSGKFFATGTANPGASIRLYLNETFLATATASQDGRYSFTISRGLAPGNYRVRVDDVDAKGAVLSRAEVPFDFAPRVAAASPAVQGEGTAPASTGTKSADASPSAADVVVPAINTTTVVRGDSLWRISKRVYGRGLRYTVIYQANQQQIRDPHLIYPGQLFVLPHSDTN